MSFLSIPAGKPKHPLKTRVPHHRAAFSSPEHYAALDSMEGIAHSNPVAVPSRLAWFPK